MHVSSQYTHSSSQLCVPLSSSQLSVRGTNKEVPDLDDLDDFAVKQPQKKPKEPEEPKTGGFKCGDGTRPVRAAAMPMDGQLQSKGAIGAFPMRCLQICNSECESM